MLALLGDHLIIWTTLQAIDAGFLRNISRTVHLLASCDLYLKQRSFPWAVLLIVALPHGPRLLTPIWIYFLRK